MDFKTIWLHFMVPSFSRNTTAWAILVESDLRIISAKLIWNLTFGLWEDFWVFPNYKYLCCHNNQSWKVIFMKLKHKIPTHEWYIQIGIQPVMWLQTKCCLKTLPKRWLTTHWFDRRPWKMGQGHTRDTIWTNLVVLSQLMLHIKFQRNQPSGSFKIFIRYDNRSHLGHVTWTVWTNFWSPIAQMLPMKFDWNWPSSFGEEVVWKCLQTFNHSDFRPRSLIDLDLWH